MVLRGLISCFFCCAVSAGAQTYFRTERFPTSPRAWKQTSQTQFYGYEPTTITGNKGAAGGLLLPTTYFNRYGDLFLGGTLQRGNPVSASGRLALVRASAQPPYVATAYIGHFSQSFAKYVSTVGIALTGMGTDAVDVQAIVEFEDGSAYASNPIRAQIAPNSKYVDWSYAWNPEGGASGLGRLDIQVAGRQTYVDLPGSSAGRNFYLDAFGLFQPSYQAPDSNTFLQLYIGDVVYTAFIGQPPVLKVKGSKRRQVSGNTIDLRGRAKVALGNKIASVKYRVIRNGRAGRYRKASGTAKWSAEISVPKGSSRILLRTISDSGLVDFEKIKVNRRP